MILSRWRTTGQGIGLVVTDPFIMAWILETK